MRGACLQWLLLTPFLAFLDVAVEDRLKPEYVSGTKLALDIFTVISTLICMYHVNVLRVVSERMDCLEPHHIKGKFLIVKLMMIIPKIVIIILAELVPSKQLANGHVVERKVMAAIWTSFVVCKYFPLIIIRAEARGGSKGGRGVVEAFYITPSFMHRPRGSYLECDYSKKFPCGGEHK